MDNENINENYQEEEEKKDEPEQNEIINDDNQINENEIINNENNLEGQDGGENKEKLNPPENQENLEEQGQKHKISFFSENKENIEEPKEKQKISFFSENKENIEEPKEKQKISFFSENKENTEEQKEKQKISFFSENKENIGEPEQKKKISIFSENKENEDNDKLNIFIASTSELNGKTLYHIKGDFLPNNTEIARRYRDFDLLYNKLCHNWPGIFLPPIPPKKYFSSSTDKKVIDERIYQLENFLQVSSKLPFITQTEEFKLFLNSQITNSDTLQADMKKILPYNYKQISENYTKYFSERKNFKKKDFTEERLKLYFDFVDDFIDKINEYKKQVVTFGEIEKRRIYRESRIIHHFTEFEKMGMNHFIENDQSLLFFHNNKFSLEEKKEKYDKEVNHPYIILSCWIRLIELELYAIKTKLNEYKDLNGKKISYNKKLNDLTQKLNDINNGKVGFFDKLFVKGDVQKLKEKTEAELKTHTDETNYINNIVEILGDYIEVEIYKYYEKVTKSFYRVVKNFVSIQKQNSTLALDIWLEVKNNKGEDTEQLNEILSKDEKNEINENINNIEKEDD